MGRPPSYYDQTGPDVIHPRSARLNGRGRSRLGRQSYGPTMDGADAHLRLQNRTGGDRRDGYFESDFANGEVEAPHDQRNYAGRHHRAEDIRASSGGHSSSRELLPGYTEEINKS